MIRAAAILLLYCAALPLDDRAVFAEAVPQLPPPLEQLLQRFGVTPEGGVPFLSDWRRALARPVRNPAYAALMERARGEDVVVPLTDSLFAPETASLALWHSDFFLTNYGCAFLLAAAFDDDRIPIILVPGINGSARDFVDLVPQLQRAGYQPVYFVYPSGMALDGAARQLGLRLKEFRDRHDIPQLVVIGHSMGGLVSKAVLDEVDVRNDLAPWQVFISISAPFGGVETAQHADRLPWRPAAWDDLAPGSRFIQKIQSTRFPADLSFYLFFSSRSSRPLMAALGNNDGVLTIHSMVASPVTSAARDVFGFYEDHKSILSAPLVFRRIERILDTELRR